MITQTLPLLASKTRVQVIYGAPYMFKGQLYVNEFHHVYSGNKIVDAYKYANIPFNNRVEAMKYVAENGGKMIGEEKRENESLFIGSAI